jgi:hypothetical protein
LIAVIIDGIGLAVGVRPMHTGIGTDTLNSGRGELHVEEKE